MNRQQLLENAKSLPRSERIDLVIELWEDIGTAGADDLPLTDAQKQELDRRIAGDKADPSPTEEWDVLKGKLLRGEF